MKIPLVDFIFPGLFLVIGVVCVSWPHVLQGTAMRSSERWPAWMLKYYPFARQSKEFMKTPRYVTLLRVIGILFIIESGLFFYFMLRFPA